MSTRSNQFGSNGTFKPKTIREAVQNKRFCQILTKKLPEWPMPPEDMSQEVIERGLEAEKLNRYDPSRGSPLSFLLGIGQLVKLESMRAWYREQNYTNASDIDLETGIQSPLDLVILTEQWQHIHALIEQLDVEDQALIYRRFGHWYGLCQEPMPMNSSERCRLCRLLEKLRRRAEAAK